MDPKILYSALIIVGGWLYLYIFVRPFLLDLTVGVPFIKKFGGAGAMSVKDARRLNAIFAVLRLIICVGIAAAVIYFCPPYLLVGFVLGILLGVGLYARKLGPRTKSNFDAFCRTYYRFIPDGELRAAAYNADLPRIRAALRALNSDLKFEFNKE